jgi:fructose-1,6-bisphosphatase/inositol monophosphatase family enzyme
MKIKWSGGKLANANGEMVDSLPLIYQGNKWEVDTESGAVLRQDLNAEVARAKGAEAGLAELLRTTWRQRAYGDFWSHMMVAEGALDIAAEPVLETYDMAALIPIVQEAGGLITSFDGGTALGGGSALTTNALLHDQVALVFRG